jgi:hypothetical protein
MGNVYLHNVAYNNTNWGFHAYLPGDDVTYRANIAFDNALETAGADFGIESGMTAVCNYNLFITANNPGLCGNSVNQDPLFFDKGNYNFRLQVGSPAIDAAGLFQDYYCEFSDDVDLLRQVACIGLEVRRISGLLSLFLRKDFVIMMVFVMLVKLLKVVSVIVFQGLIRRHYSKTSGDKLFVWKNNLCYNSSWNIVTNINSHYDNFTAHWIKDEIFDESSGALDLDVEEFTGLSENQIIVGSIEDSAFVSSVASTLGIDLENELLIHDEHNQGYILLIDWK